MWGAISSVFWLLIPPLDADPGHQYRWRVTMAALMILVIGAISVHIALACGRIPLLFSGFATADALSTANKTQADALNVANTKMDRILQSQIKDLILANRAKECAAITAKPINAAARDYALQALQNALDAWRTQTGYEYDRVPSCDELGN